MNIVQLHDRVRFFVDTVASTRFESDDIDLAINNSIREIVDEKYDQSRLNHRGDSFQRTQRIRDELSNITKEDDVDGSLHSGTFTMTKNSGYVMLEIGSFPTDYKHLLAIALYVDSTKYVCWPLTYNRKNVVEKNPYRRVRSGLFNKLYFIESDQGIKILHPFDTASPTNVEVAYLADPVDSFYGYEKGPSDTVGFNTPCIATLTPTEYNSVEYKSGDTFTTNGVLGVITYGLVVTGFIDPEINGFLHEEIAKRAAANCLLSAGDYEKYQRFKAETLAV